MSYAPQNLLDVRDYVQTQTGLSDNDLGIVGDPAHKTGYHLGKDRTTSRDYSRQLARDIAGLTNAASASDIGNFSGLVALTAFLLDWARSGRANDPATGKPLIRAINGPAADGRAYRWDSQDGWEPEIRPEGDSHETHVHIEWFRDTEFMPKVWLFQEFFEGDDMFCAYGDKGSQKVVAMQVMVVNAGQRIGTSDNPYHDVDGNYGDATAKGLGALMGDDGRNYGPWQYAALHRLNSLPGPQGEPGKDGERGPKGDPGTFEGQEFIATGKFTHAL